MFMVLQPVSKISRDRKAASYVSAAVITSMIAALVVVASFYGFNILDSQRRASELETIKNSMGLLGDAVEWVAWSPGSSRTVRFMPRYGALRLMPSVANYSISVDIGAGDQNIYNDSTGAVRYVIRDIPLNLGYEEWVVGGEEITTDMPKSLQRIVVRRGVEYTNVTLDFVVRMAKTTTMTSQGTVDLIKIWVIDVNTTMRGYTGDVGLKCSGGETEVVAWPGVDPATASSATVTVDYWGRSESRTYAIGTGKVYVQVIVGKVTL